MKRVRRCYLHVGTHKTGTTSIQALLGANSDLLSARGVLVPRAGRRDPALGGHHNIAWELNGDPRFDPRFGGLDALTNELAASTERDACLSSEDFELLATRTDDALARLRAALERAGFVPRVVVYVRSQTTYCESMYAELVQSGYRTPFAEYVQDVLRLGTFRWGEHTGTLFDYARLLDAFANVFGREALVVRRYGPGISDSTLLASFAAVLGLTLSEFVVPPRLNRAATFRGVLGALGRNAEPDDAALPFAPLSLAQRLRVTARFLASNLAIARRYRVFVSPAGPPARTPARLRRGLADARRILGSPP